MKNVYISISTDPVGKEDFFNNLIKHTKNVAESGADFLHCDIMDGEFVSRKTFDESLLSKIKQNTNIPLDVHLMVEKPWKKVRKFISSGANFLTLHFESFYNKKNKVRKSLLLKTIKVIKENFLLVGISIKPETKVSEIEEYLKLIDIILIMSVNPGKSGQSFIENTYEKIKNLSEIRKENNLNFKISVDGGIVPQISKKLISLGADIIVSGSYFYSSKNRKEAVKSLK